MSKSSTPEHAEERSTSKSADSLTIASDLDFSRPNGVDIGPQSQSGPQPGTLAPVVSSKTESSTAQPAGPSVSATQGHPQAIQGSQALPQTVLPLPEHSVPHQPQATPSITHALPEGQSTLFGAQNPQLPPHQNLQHPPQQPPHPTAPDSGLVPNGYNHGDSLRSHFAAQHAPPKMIAAQSLPMSQPMGHALAHPIHPPNPSMAALQQPQQQLPQNGLAGARQVSINEVQKVQTYIEKCLQLYLSQKEVVSQLELQCQIEPAFTQLVWQKLEEQNQEFFRAYYTRLKLKDQIVLFNHLLDEQVKISQRIQPKSHTLPAAAPLMQPVTSLPNHVNHTFPQQRLGVPAQAPSSQPPVHTSAPAQPMQNHFPSSQPPANHVPNHVPNHAGAQAPAAAHAEFGNMPGLETGAADAELGANSGHALPYVGSGLDLANMAMHGIGEGLLDGHHPDFGMSRDYSLGDLGMENHQGGMNRNISFTDFPSLDADLG